MNTIINLFTVLRFLPHLVIYGIHPNRKFIHLECSKWLKALRIKHSGILGFLYLLKSIKEYRNVLYLRCGASRFLLNLIAPQTPLVFFDTTSDRIGNGLILQHGFSTIINAKTIGENCQIWHNVTIGKSKSGTDSNPIIEDNVFICAGAIVLGNITIGRNSVVGAGAVVMADVPANVTVAGNPAVIIKRRV